MILSKNSNTDGRFSNFDKYIRKPFLPTDIYEVLKKEKYNDMNLSTSYDSVSVDNVDISVADSDIDLDDNLLKATDVSDIDMSNIGASINDIDLSDFNDSQDEFITGTMNELDSIPAENNNYGFMDDIGIMPQDMQNSNTQVSTDNLDSIEPSVSKNDIVFDNNSFGSNNNVKSGKDDGDIDFSSVFALQDEILRTQEQDKKSLVGGDISVKKDSNKENDAIDVSNVDENINDDLDNSILQQKHSTLPDDSVNIGDIHVNNNMYNDFVEDDSLSIDPVLDTSLNTISDDNNDNKSGSTYNIETMSEQELEALDDETLLRLQEDSSASGSETMVLDKSTIDEVNDMLHQTENYNDSKDNPKFVSQDFDSLTEEALNKALQEDGNINYGTDIQTDLSNFKDDSLNNNQANMSMPPPASVNMNSMSDISEIIRAFPVDKLRELLSGAQITINITFPSKNN